MAGSMEDRDLAIMLFCIGVFVYALLFCLLKAKKSCLSGEDDVPQWDAAVSKEEQENQRINESNPDLDEVVTE